MSRPVRLLPAARVEFDEAADWYEGQQAGLGLDFIAKVREILDRIAADPQLHAPIDLDIRKYGNRRMPMATDLIHDRGRGPEIAGTRITVYNLLPHFLDSAETEADIGRIYELTPEQVAAARAYVLNNPDTVLAEHLEIEARMAAGNPPGVIERAKETHASFMSFKRWLAEREDASAWEHTAEVMSESVQNSPGRSPTFREWLAEQESRPGKGS